MKKLEEIIFEQQAQIDLAFGNKDEVFRYMVKEANSFGRVSSKISNELSNQTSALEKKYQRLISQLGSESPENYTDEQQRSSPVVGNFSPPNKFISSNQYEEDSSKTRQRANQNQNELIDRLQAQIQHLKQQIDSQQVSTSPSDEILNKQKEVYNLRFRNFDTNLQSTWNLMNEKLSIYENRVNEFENLVSSRIQNATQSSSEKSVYKVLVDSLNKNLSQAQEEIDSLTIK